MAALTLDPRAPATARPQAPSAQATANTSLGTPGTLWSLAGLSLALLLGFTLAGALDGRLLAGTNVWLKPAKFAVSFVVLFMTMALVVERLSPAVRQGRLLRTTLAVMVVATVGEMAYIGAQAGRGVHSHFSVSTPFTALMYSLMRLGAVALVVGIGIVGVLAWRDRSARFAAPLRVAIGIGFVLSAVLTLVVAGYLAGHGSHSVGAPSADGARVPLFGWSLEVGDLRPAHFLALHAMQALPLLGLWLARHGREGTALLWAAAAAYFAFTLAIFVQALMGLPLLRL
jgi:hypothetical protein